jgi:DNA adenine methylase
MLAPWIIEHFPPHRIYTEAFGGAASVLMRKPRAKLVEVYNDLDGEIVNLFRVLRDPVTAGALREVLQRTPFARDEFEAVLRTVRGSGRAGAAHVVRSFFGFGSDSASGATTGFRANGNRQTAHPARDWSNYPAAVEAFTERLKGVVVENRPASRSSCSTTPRRCTTATRRTRMETRSAYTCQDRQGLSARNDRRRPPQARGGPSRGAGMVVLSGYYSRLYNELYGAWDAPALERVEILWLNPACSDALAHRQPRMFA